MLEEKLLQANKRHRLFQAGDSVGCAVSGGADSMALLYALHSLQEELSIKVCALHLEHGIRGESAFKDMELVKAFCREKGIPLYVKREDVASLAAGRNLEECARERRYAFFEECKEKYRLDKIAVAHHLNDLAETFLLNLVRGSGPRGLSALLYENGRGVVRPLLDAEKSEIRAYAEEKGIPFREDETNADTSLSRNYIRIEVMPRLQTLNPAAPQAIRRAADILLEEDDALSEIAGEVFFRLAEEKVGEIRFPIGGLLALHPAIAKRVVRLAIEKTCGTRDVEHQNILSVLALAESGKTGKEFSLPGKFFCRVSYNTLIIGSKLYKIVRNGAFVVGEGENALFPGERLLIEPCPFPECFFPADSLTQYADMDGVLGAEVRTRRDGDTFRPLGMKGEKSLSDWMIDAKVPREERDGPLLCRGSRVLWIVGRQMGEDIKISAGSIPCRMTYFFTEEENGE